MVRTNYGWADTFAEALEMAKDLAKVLPGIRARPVMRS